MHHERNSQRWTNTERTLVCLGFKWQFLYVTVMSNQYFLYSVIFVLTEF